ncbi:MAG: efflux RND transporter periplasmic adaptor subunit [Pseudomonadota bacterium]
MTSRKFKAKVARLGRNTIKITVTGGVIALAVLAVQHSSDLLADRASAVGKPPVTAPLSVSTATIDLVDTYAVERRYTGQIEAPQSADLSFEQGGTLAQVLVEGGDTIEKGQVLARLDKRLLAADLNRLKASKKALMAQLELASLTSERQEKLKKRGFASNQVADQARLSMSELNARMAEADAGILAAQIRLEKAELRAPFDGVVSKRLMDPGNTVGNGQSVLSLIEDDRPVFRVGIDPTLAESLSVGGKIKVTLGQKPHQATIIGILPQIDGATRTRIVRAQLPTLPNMAFGQTGDAVLVQRMAQKGAWVPLTALEDGLRGLWTIKTVTGEDAQVVGTEAVEIIHADSTRAFVRGTFENGTHYIDQGIHRVVVGQNVRAQGETQ